MPATAAPTLLHVVGYLTGASLYGLLLVMALSSRGAARRPVLWTGLLGLGWNAGELATHLADALGHPSLAAWCGALSYAALGFLAAVAVHAAGRGPASDDAGPARHLRAIAAGAYATATLAGLLQARAAALHAPLPSSDGLLVLTAGIGVLAVALLVATRRQANSRRALWIATLALVAVSALHLGQGHGGGEGWVTELAGHQAAIPLALALLYQDYRFAFVDLFLKRALTLLALVTLAFAGWSAASLAPGAATRSPGFAGLLMGLWVATALVYPWLRTAIAGFVDRVLLRRVDYDALVDRLAEAVQACASTDDVLRVVTRDLSLALDAPDLAWAEAGEARPDSRSFRIVTADPPHLDLRIGRLAAGRRLLSDDRLMLDRVATLAGRRIDAIRLGEERFALASREQAARALATEAELRALRAQINPHFLFNALTTIGDLIQHAPQQAVSTLMRLTTLLRAVLRSDGTSTTLGQECHLIECYLDIERERFEERLAVIIDVPEALRSAEIPTLVVQPLVENAIKHGIAPAPGGGVLHLMADAIDDGRSLRIVVRNTGMPLGTPASGGIGLENVRQRLQHSYGERAGLALTADGAATVATITLPLTLRAVTGGPRLERVS